MDGQAWGRRLTEWDAMQSRSWVDGRSRSVKAERRVAQRYGTNWRWCGGIGQWARGGPRLGGRRGGLGGKDAR